MHVFRYLKAHPHQIARYPKLKTLDADSLSAECSHTGFEAMAAEYLKVGLRRCGAKSTQNHNFRLLTKSSAQSKRIPEMSHPRVID